MAEISSLRRRMVEDMTVRNLSPETQRSYIHAVSKFSRHFDRSPDRLRLEDVRAFQVHLVSNRISWAGLNQIVCALKLFYGVTLGRDETPERIPYARNPKKLPVILSADEVVRFFQAIPCLRNRVAMTTAYASGLRISEAVRLKSADIDSSRMVIRVERGKGGKDRYVTILHAACHCAVEVAGLDKRVTPHVLRHCFATHLLEADTDMGDQHPGDGAFNCRFEVLGEAPAPANPSEGSFDHPAARK